MNIEGTKKTIFESKRGFVSIGSQLFNDIPDESSISVVQDSGSLVIIDHSKTLHERVGYKIL
jgi:hypothetical protein